MIRIACISLFAFAVGCGAAEHRAPFAPTIELPMKRFLERAEVTTARGAYASAAAYYEAALDSGGSETFILPRLVTSLVRGGELRRALLPLARLRSLCPENENYESLEGTIRSLLTADGSPLGDEAVR